MPYHFEGSSLDDGKDIVCSSCKKKFLEAQGCFECDTCHKFYHCACKDIRGMHIRRLAAKPTWHCSVPCSAGSPSNRSKDNTKTSLVEKPQHENVPPIVSDTVINNKLDVMMNNISVQNASVNASIKQLDKTMIEIKESQEFLSSQFDKALGEIKELQEDNMKLKNTIREIQEQQTKTTAAMSIIEAQLDELKQDKLTNNVLITGFRDNCFEPTETVQKIFTCINADIKNTDIKKINFINTNNSKTNNQLSQQRSVVSSFIEVEFTNFAAKKLLQDKMKEKGTLFTKEVGLNYQKDHRIYVRDKLTRFRAKLLRDTIIMKNRLQLKYVWVNYQKIHIRKDDNSKTYVIHTKEDLFKTEIDIVTQ